MSKQHNDHGVAITSCKHSDMHGMLLRGNGYVTWRSEHVYMYVPMALLALSGMCFALIGRGHPFRCGRRRCLAGASTYGVGTRRWALLCGWKGAMTYGSGRWRLL